MSVWPIRAKQLPPSALLQPLGRASGLVIRSCGSSERHELTNGRAHARPGHAGEIPQQLGELPGLKFSSSFHSNHGLTS